MQMLRLERTGEKLMRMVALCADVEIAELKEPWSKMSCVE